MLIPAERLIDWTPGVNVGVEGGIAQYITGRSTLIDVTQAPYNADNTGVTDTAAALQAAINAAGAGEVVYLPTGTYRIDSQLNLPIGFSGKTLRGDGPENTFIDQRTNVGIVAGNTAGYFNPDPPILVVGGLVKGSTEITVDDSTNLTVGRMILLQIESDQSIPVVSVYNYDIQTNQAPTTQMVRVISKVGNDVEIWPPLHDSYGGGSLEIRVLLHIFEAELIGIESLCVDATNYVTDGGAFQCVGMSSCQNSWIYNCTIRQAKNYNLGIGTSLNCEIREVFLDGLKGMGSNGACLLFNAYSSLVEDNIFVDGFPLIEVNAGSSGNVIAYNYGSSGGAFNSNHSPQNRFNLYEGNVTDYQISDGYFGGESECTIFRGFYYGFGVNMRRFSRRFSVIGCYSQPALGDHGYPNIGNTDSNGTAQPSLGDWWRDYDMQGVLSTRTDDASGVITLSSGELFEYDGLNLQVIRLVWGAGKDNQRFAGVDAPVVGDVVPIINYSGGTPLPAEGTTLYIGPGAYFNFPNGSYQELDLDVAETVVRKGNRYLYNDSFDSLDGDTLPDSLYLSEAPDFFDGFTWPPYDPVTPVAPDILAVPAAFRYFGGLTPSAPEITTPCTVTGDPTQGSTLTAIPGVVTGNPPPARTWKWQRDGVDIGGATSITYELQAEDVGFEVGPVQVETNSEGSDESVAIPLLIEAFDGDLLILSQTANADPVTELWKGVAVDSNGEPVGVIAPFIIHHSGPYPTQPNNDFLYARHGSQNNHIYIFAGTITLAEAVAGANA